MSDEFEYYELLRALEESGEKIATLGAQNELLRAAIVEWASDEFGEFCPNCLGQKLQTGNGHRLDCPYKAAVKGGAMEERQ